MFKAEFKQGSERRVIQATNFYTLVRRLNIHNNQVLKVLDSLERTGYAEYGWYDIYTTEVQNA